MALSSDLKTFAIVNGKSESASTDLSAIIYSVTWNGNTPSFTYKYSIPLSGTYEVGQMEFDHADNLYIASRQQGLLVYAIKNPSRQTTTMGIGEIIGVGVGEGETGVESVEINNAPIEYYNLQGVKVENPSNGIFIKVQGDKVTKGYIK